MADLEAVLADVSYLMAMEKSKNTPAARASKKIILPDPSVRSVMHRYLEKNKDVTFEKIFTQRIGFLLFKEYCEQLPDPVPQLTFYEETRKYEALDTPEERMKAAKEIYDKYVMKELLSHTHTYSKEAVDHVQKHLMKGDVPSNLFEPYIEEIFNSLKGDLFDQFIQRLVYHPNIHFYVSSLHFNTSFSSLPFLSLSEKYVRFCQWKNFELNIQLTMNDFSVHRIIGRGGFGEVYGCRKADTGKM